LGIELRQLPVKLMSGGTRYDPCIYFSGFSSQGDGACFEGTYRYKKGSVKAIKAHAPQDKELHRIAKGLQEAQRPTRYSITANIKHRGRYYHPGCMEICFVLGQQELAQGLQVAPQDAPGPRNAQDRACCHRGNASGQCLPARRRSPIQSPADSDVRVKSSWFAPSTAAPASFLPSSLILTSFGSKRAMTEKILFQVTGSSATESAFGAPLRASLTKN
jgi:hypothetical protein